MDDHPSDLTENPAHIISMVPPALAGIFMEIHMPAFPTLYDPIPDLPKRIDVELRVRIRR